MPLSWPVWRGWDADGMSMVSCPHRATAARENVVTDRDRWRKLTCHQKPQNLDFDKLKEFVKHVFDFLSGAVVSGMIHLGDRLGLYAALRDAGPVTSEELAHKTGLNERWVREWLRGQARGAIGRV